MALVGTDVSEELRASIIRVARIMNWEQADVSEELSASIIRMTRIGELGIKSHTV
jgi:hypothetical protein